MCNEWVNKRDIFDDFLIQPSLTHVDFIFLRSLCEIYEWALYRSMEILGSFSFLDDTSYKVQVRHWTSSEADGIFSRYVLLRHYAKWLRFYEHTDKFEQTRETLASHTTRTKCPLCVTLIHWEIYHCAVWVNSLNKFIPFHACARRYFEFKLVYWSIRKLRKSMACNYDVMESVDTNV